MKNRHCCHWLLPLLLLPLLSAPAHGPRPAAHPPHRLVQGPVQPPQEASRPLPPLAPPPVRGRPRPQAETATRTLEARLLVVSADGTEPGLGTLRQALEYLGTPYTLHVAREQPGSLTPQALAEGLHGRYQGILLATSSLAWFDGTSWQSALSLEEWQALADYELTFGVRQVTWYTYPTPQLGFGPPTPLEVGTQPLPLHLTEAGRTLFPYLSGEPLPLRLAYVYQALPAPDTTPLLVDAHGHALAALARLEDGRENLALTFDGNRHQVHAVALTYGAIQWVTRGLFVGYRRVYMGPQVDDLFLDNDMWSPDAPLTYRLGGEDLQGIAHWQQQVRQGFHSPALRLAMAFNGLGTRPGEYPQDTLTPTAQQLASHFEWISHTYTHPYLDQLPYREVSEELRSNVEVARRLRLEPFSACSLVTPNITGLRNEEAMGAAWDRRVRFVVTDTSLPGHESPVPNGALHNWVVPALQMIPRRPTNLFYNVSTPAEWEGQYNALYRQYWGRDLSYAEILDFESDMLQLYLLRGELYPWMFHQANLRQFAPGHSLLTDLLQAALEKYRRVYTLPVASPSMDELGERAVQRRALAESGVRVTLGTDGSLTLVAQREVIVPLTGLAAEDEAVEVYGGQPTTFITLEPQQPVVLQLAEPQGGGPAMARRTDRGGPRPRRDRLSECRPR